MITGNTQYRWPLNWEKYSLDQKKLNEDLCYSDLVERSREAAAQQLTDPLTRMHFLQGKGQVNGISLSTLYRPNLLGGSVPMFVRKAPTNDFSFQKKQQASSVNTQDQHQIMHVPVDDGGNTNMEILDEAVCDVSAPTTGSIH